MSVQELLRSHPDWPAIQAIYHKLIAHGYKAFLAGGCVRDALLGKTANDLDLATDALPDQIESLFVKTLAVGKSFGVIRVLELESDIEVASFRSDGNYQDGRRPESVQWAAPEEDAKRRDFTVNAMFWDLQNEVIVDYVQGLQDLKNRKLRAVGDCDLRFKEDHLRLLRAVRFAGQLQFGIEEKTFLAIQRSAAKILSVSGERLREEMTKLLMSAGVNEALKLLWSSGLQKNLFPYFSEVRQLLHSDCEVGWQVWTLFWLPAKLQNVEGSLDVLRFSNKERDWILSALSVLHNPSVFFARRMGQQLVDMRDTGVEFSLELVKINTEFAPRALMLENKWTEMGKMLPPAFLRGDDVKAFLKGSEIKACLNQAYWEQLEGGLNSRDEAILWMQNYTKNLRRTP